MTLELRIFELIMNCSIDYNTLLPSLVHYNGYYEVKAQINQFLNRSTGILYVLFVSSMIMLLTQFCLNISAVPSKNEVSAIIKHSRYFH